MREAWVWFLALHKTEPGDKVIPASWGVEAEKKIIIQGHLL